MAITQQKSGRLQSIDMLRGLVIILMALDHTRDFWGASNFSPTDLGKTDVFWFFTRWVTHFCAPVFILLTGISAFLYEQKCATKMQLSRFLFTRGLWLVVLELTIVNLSWQFDYNYVFVQVIWTIGLSMIILAGLIHLPKPAIIVISLAVILLHNAFNDEMMVAVMGDYAWVWKLLHQRGWIPIPEMRFGVVVSYPFLPWFGVMGLGYAIGSLYLQQAADRRRFLHYAGIGLIAVFVALRLTGIYGDPNVWQGDGDLSHTIMSFFNTTKYPASLQFLSMTLGPALILLAVSERWDNGATRVLNIFGKVPMFFYLIHVPLINLAAHAWTALAYGKAVNFFNGPRGWPESYEPNLLRAYIAWIVLVAMLYFPCRWYAAVKARSNNKWLSYL